MTANAILFGEPVQIFANSYPGFKWYRCADGKKSTAPAWCFERTWKTNVDLSEFMKGI